MNLDKNDEYLNDEHLNEVLNKVDVLGIGLSNEVEKKDSGNVFGKLFFNDSELLFSNFEKRCGEFNLSDFESSLFKIVLKSHDLGRYVEATNNLNDFRGGARHGKISRELLINDNILEGLSNESKEIIYDAVEYHAEREVELEEDSLSYKLCYILRDLDKLHIMEDEKYLEDNGALELLNKHYFNGEIKNKNNYVEFVGKVLLGEDIYKNNLGDVKEGILNILNNGIAPEQLEIFISRKTLHHTDWRESYTTYMLYTIAFVFDIKNKSVLIDTINTPMFKSRLDFIKNRVSENYFNQILDTLKNYINEFLGEFIIENNLDDYYKKINTII